MTTYNKYVLNPNLEIFVSELDRKRNQYHRLATQPSDSKVSIAEDLDQCRQYYSGDRLPVYLLRGLSRLRLVIAATVLVILFILMSYKTPPVQQLEIPETENEGFGEHIPMKALGGRLDCDASLLQPSAVVPDDVNRVRPADIRVIAALGDSITAASTSKNFADEERDTYFGNSFATGVDEPLSKHITIANILRSLNPSLVGGSHGRGYGENTGFNVAVGGKTCEDLPRQADELVARIKASKVDLAHDWKLVNLFIGTNDIGNLSCYTTFPPISPAVYKSRLELTLSILKSRLPRTIVSITAMWNPQVTIEAASIIDEGKRKTCGPDDSVIAKREKMCDDYRRVAYELQNEKKFDSKEFTVVVQGFMDDIKDAFRNKTGAYDLSFYGDDHFHLSKYGNGLFAKWLWNGMVQPVGRKDTKADWADDDRPIQCPDKDYPFIRTLGNSQ